MLVFFVCFRNPSNSDVDYRIFKFNVRTSLHDHSYECVYTQGLGTPTVSQHNISDSTKLLQFFLVLLMGFKPRVIGQLFKDDVLDHKARVKIHVHVSI